MDRQTDRQPDSQTDSQADRWIDRQTDRQPYRQTYRKTDIQSDRHKNKQTDRQRCRQKNKQTDIQADRQTARQSNRHTHRQTCRQTDRQTDRKTNRQPVLTRISCTSSVPRWHLTLHSSVQRLLSSSQGNLVSLHHPAIAAQLGQHWLLNADCWALSSAGHFWNLVAPLGQLHTAGAHSISHLPTWLTEANAATMYLVWAYTHTYCHTHQIHQWQLFWNCPSGWWCDQQKWCCEMQLFFSCQNSRWSCGVSALLSYDNCVYAVQQIQVCHMA